MPIALTREISPAIAHCELTHLARVPIDLERARQQHAAYESALKDAGCSVTRLSTNAEMPDSVFIEDTAVVFNEVAIIARPGAASRRAETPAVVEALRPHREIIMIENPGTMDGGDVLALGRRVLVGVSSRTNREGIAQMRCALEPHGYSVEEIQVRGCLHLKSAVTQAGKNLVLMNPAWLPPEPFAGMERIEVDPSEPMAANAVLIGERVIFGAAFPRTLNRLRNRGLDVRTLDASEVAKAEGALTCCSLIFESKQDSNV